MAADDTDLLAAALAEEASEVIPARDDHIPPDIPPSGRTASGGADANGWMPLLNDGGQVEVFHESEADAIVIVGPKGCRPLDTQVYTADGLIRLGRLKPDDAKPDSFTPISQPVVSFDGRGVVTATANQYWAEAGRSAIRAHLENGYDLTGSSRHPVWVCWQSPDGKHGFGYKRLSEIESGRTNGWRFWTPFMGHPTWSKRDYTRICVPGEFAKSCDCGGPAIARGLCATHYAQRRKANCLPVRPTRDVILDEDVGYLLGALVGDGHLNCSDGRDVMFSNVDAECISAAGAGAKKIGCELRRVDSITSRVSPGSRIRPLILALDLAHTSYQKRIPNAVIESPRSVAAAFLSGLFDTDGTVEKAGTIQLCTVSENLSTDVQSLLAAFGILSVRREFVTAAGSRAWKIGIMGEFAYEFGRQIGFRISRKQSRIRGPVVSGLCPNGFNRNYYGYPAPIKTEMRRLSLLSNNGSRDRQWHKDNKSLKSFGSIPSRHKLERFCDAFGCRDDLRDFMVSTVWLEVESTSRTECELGDLHVPGTHAFLAAGTINHNSGKTDIALNRLVRHCYENNNALALVIGITQRVATEGAGFDLVDRILPMWRDGNRYPMFTKNAVTGELTPHPMAGELMDSGIGLEFTKWSLDPVTKDRHLWIRNRFNGWSKVLLVSIQHASEVQKKLFGIQPSMVYIEELMNADGSEYYSVPYAQLGRRRGISGPQIWMATQNTESPEHWTHSLLYKDCVVTSGGRTWPKDPEKPGIMRDRKWGVFYIWFEENAHNLPKGYRERLMLAYRSDKTLAQRMLEAKWLAYPSGEAIFKETFSEERHVFGNSDRGTGLLPSKGHPIVIGYDPGTANPSITLEQIIDTSDGTALKIFDELVFYQTHVSYYRLTKMLMEKMLYWQRRMDYLFEFRFISDDQATTAYNPSRGSVGARDIQDYYKQIREADPGRYATLPESIRIIGCPKPPGSVEARVSLINDALFELRVLVSAACKVHRAMFLHLERDKESPATPKRSRHIHPFDSCSYPLFYRRHVLKAPFKETGNRGAVTISIG